MLPLELRLDEFVEFLADHSDEVVGYAGISFFHNPLAEWLTQKYRFLVAVDVDSYSRLSSPSAHPLPRWGRLLASSLERCSPVPLTGEMVFSILSSIEVGALLPRF